ncbi:unnamed protein product [Thlaspi arvense]|uniref:TF-B3 domain-containing protein n=1 Tax=Thlaspi arvense TaxID=13288 RepID=A0AAU9RD05_THLAR|nr:unnamed protein product [Thlaspi arvense]
MGWKTDFGPSKEDGESLSFFKVFQGDDLSSESKRAFPYNFISKVSQEEISRNMVIRTQWGSSWEVGICKNARFYYMDRRGWSQFVSDNALGQNEYVTFTHKGNMCFHVSIFGKNDKEIITPRDPRTMAYLSGIKKEQGESSNKALKEEEETGESMGVVELNVRKKKAKEEPETSKKKKIKGDKVEPTVPQFEVILLKSYLAHLPIPSYFIRQNHIPNKSTTFTIHHENGNGSWEVSCLVKKTYATTLSAGWSKLARQYPLSIGDVCTFQLIKPTEFRLVVGQ